MNFIKKYKYRKEYAFLTRKFGYDLKDVSTDFLIGIYIEVMEELYSREDFNSTQDLQLSYGIIKKILENRGVYNV